MDFFGLDPSIGTSSALIQQRAKITPEAVECLFQHFTNKVDENKLYHGLWLLAVDSSDLQIATNPNGSDFMYNFCELITQSVVIQQEQRKYT